MRGRKFLTNIKISILSTIILCTYFCTYRVEPEKIFGLRSKIVGLCKSLVGIPYRYGGDDIDGFDCSGFVYYVYDSFGVKIPRNAKKQGKIRYRIRFKHARPGDIVVFKLKRGWHTGIYINKRYFIHSPKKKETVRTEQFNSYWKGHLKSVINVIDNL
jgi:cell wall-associated NlpC family hydrolase